MKLWMGILLGIGTLVAAAVSVLAWRKHTARWAEDGERIINMKEFPNAILFMKNYFSDQERSHIRIVQFSKISVIINGVIALGKIGMGIYSLSFFLCINGLYNVGIGLAKATAIKGYSDSVGASVWTLALSTRQIPHKKQNKRRKYRYCYWVGIIILISSILYVIGSVFGKRGNANYSSFMMYTVYILVVAELIISLQGIKTTRKNKEPILEAIKRICLVSSLIAFVLVQTAIQSHFGHESNLYFNSAGIALGFASVLISLHMILSTKTKITNK